MKDYVILVIGSKIGCPNCNIYKKILDEGRIDYEFIDVKERPELIEEYKILSIPTTVIIRNGHMVAKRSGSMSVNKLNDFINQSCRL